MVYKDGLYPHTIKGSLSKDITGNERTKQTAGNPCGVAYT